MSCAFFLLLLLGSGLVFWLYLAIENALGPDWPQQLWRKNEEPTAVDQHRAGLARAAREARDGAGHQAVAEAHEQLLREIGRLLRNRGHEG